MRADNLAIPKKINGIRPRLINDCHKTRKGNSNLDGRKSIIALNFYVRLQQYLII